jgi:anthraniloyl-CoA monooxygenase
VHHNGRAPVVLMGDAAHTAHFSIGSGTKLALEDSIELARCIGSTPSDLPAALRTTSGAQRRGAAHPERRRATRPSGSRTWSVMPGLPPAQFAYSLLTRSQRISHENLRLRDRKYLEAYEDWIAERAGVKRQPAQLPIPPMFTPYTGAA